jgi:hypothetical protein
MRRHLLAISRYHRAEADSNCKYSSAQILYGLSPDSEQMPFRSLRKANAAPEWQERAWGGVAEG